MTFVSQVRSLNYRLDILLRQVIGWKIKAVQMNFRSAGAVRPGRRDTSERLLSTQPPARFAHIFALSTRSGPL